MLLSNPRLSRFATKARMMHGRSVSWVLGGVALLAAGTAAGAAEVNLYTTREPGLIKPLLDAFTAKSGIKVNTVFVKEGLAERVAAEGAQLAGRRADDRRRRQPDRPRRQGRHPAGQLRPSSKPRCPHNLRDAERPLVRAVDAGPRRLRRQGPARPHRRSPTRTSPTRNGRARSASAPASTPTTPR